jgi:hypothetical protein
MHYTPSVKESEARRFLVNGQQMSNGIPEMERYGTGRIAASAISDPPCRPREANKEDCPHGVQAVFICVPMLADGIFWHLGGAQWANWHCFQMWHRPLLVGHFDPTRHELGNPSDTWDTETP